MPRLRVWAGVLCGLALGSIVPWPWTPRATPTVRESVSRTPASGRSEQRDAALGPTQRSTALEPPREQTRKGERKSIRLSPSEVAQRALRASVFVRVGSTYGAGVMLDNGHVLTCGHVLDDADTQASILVEASDGTSFEATLLQRDRELDLALLSIPDRARPRPALAPRAALSIGDEVFAMGAPKRMAFSLHRGMVSFVGREFDGIRYLQTDLPTNGGNSGGPILNDRGEIIALASFILRDSQGIAFALPIDYALERFSAWLGAKPPDTKKSANPN